jgi:hypothetical protein
MVTGNKMVACSPFPKQSVEKTIKGGIALIDRKVNLQQLTVVLRNGDGSLIPGLKVWVRGDASVQPWAKEVFSLDGEEFILVPESAIFIVGPK